MQQAFDALNDETYISLTTFRQSGQAVPTPVWFGQADGKLYIRTVGYSGKVKRLRANEHVTVAPCTVDGTVTGPALDAVARVLDDDELAVAVAEAVLDGKYGDQRRESTEKMRRKGIPLVLLEVAPA